MLVWVVVFDAPVVTDVLECLEIVEITDLEVVLFFFLGIVHLFGFLVRH